jgi:hypothetical protein
MRGFDKEPTSERPTASVDQVWRLAALMPRRFQAASGIERSRLRLMRGSDAAVTANGPLMACGDRIAQPSGEA